MRPQKLTPATLALSLTATCLASTSATAQGPAPDRTVTVVGRGEVSAAPDVAILELAVETTATEAQQATAENAKKATAVVEALQAKLSSEDTVATTRYQLDPRYAARRPGSQAPPEITGYVARNFIRAEVHALDTVGEVLDAAIEAGANRTTQLNFALEERGPHLAEALSRAGSEARVQAVSIADALGVKLREVLSASTTAPPVAPSNRVQRFAVSAAMEAAPSTPVEPGEIHLTATLTVTYRIE